MRNEVRHVNGYRAIYQPEHPRAMSSFSWSGYVYEHIAIAEEMLKRPLRDNEVVHHLDFNRANNRYENLLVLERGQHSKLHAWLAAGAPTPEDIKNGHAVKTKLTQPSFCASCGRTLQLQCEKYCSSACSHETRRKVARPSPKELRKDIEAMPFVHIGKKYGVSDTAIKKWARAYGLPTTRIIKNLT